MKIYADTSVILGCFDEEFQQLKFLTPREILKSKNNEKE
jgi:hypothetical protein